MSLGQAREKAAASRTAVADGRDLAAEKHAPAMPTFREAAQTVHEAHRARWRTGKHIERWVQTLERHAMPALGNTELDHIERGDVLRVLNPTWTNRGRRRAAADAEDEGAPLSAAVSRGRVGTGDD